MKQKKVEIIPNWAGENVFQVSSNDDVLSSFYAPVSNGAEKKQSNAGVESDGMNVRNQTKPEIQVESETKPSKNKVSKMNFSKNSSTSIESETIVKSSQRRNLMGRKDKIADSLAGNGQGIYIRDDDNSRVSYITLAEILPGKSLDLYLALYRETHALNPPKPFVRLTKNELREKSGILNQKTLNGHEKYLLAARIITRFTRSGDHAGSIYEVKKLSEVGVDATMQIEFERLLND